MDLPAAPLRDAGFWRRLAAWLIDGLVLLPLLLVGWPLAMATVGWGPLAAGGVGLLATAWLYQAGCESSGWQATVGKRALGLRVVGPDDRRVGFGRATARLVAKGLSAAPLLLGFALAGVTRRKQALHDLVASTRVVMAGPGRDWLAAATVLAAVGLLFGGVNMAGTQLSRRSHRQVTVMALGRLASLASAERDLQERTGDYLPIAAPTTGRPGKERRPWTAEERASSAAIGWALFEDQASYFTYRLVVGRTGAGNPTWAACAEADLDGDGVYQALIAFQQAPDAAGVEVAPPAPCTLGPKLELPLDYQGRSDPHRASPKEIY
jgi:uncharacterized RDD family membrane protein YckC